MNDKELIRSVITGDNRAMRELIIKYQDLVLNTCYKITGLREDAEDIAQEVFIETYRSASSLRYEDDISFWLYRISLNKSINHRKRKKNTIFRSILHIDSICGDQASEINTPHSDDIPGKDLEIKERQNILRRAVESLPAMQRKAFILHYYEDLPYKEICKVLDLSVSSVESLLFRARNNLKSRCCNIFSFDSTEPKE